MQKVLDQLTAKLNAAFGARLVSVVMYGSAAGGGRDRYSDYNILCVLDRVTPEELAHSESISRWWREKGNPAPLLLSARELAASTDCFAIEFQDIKARHEILYGADVIAPLRVEGRFHRAQVEFELRAKLLRLRQKATGMLSQKDLLRRLLLDSVSTFCVLFRHALLVGGIETGTEKREAVERAAETFHFDPGPFTKLLDIREGRLKPRDVEPVGLLASCLEAVGAVIDGVDRMEKS